MISVKVKAIMKMAEVMGCHEQVMSLPEGSRIGNLLDVLEEKYGQPLSEILHKGDLGELRPNLIFLLNGTNILFLDGFETNLNDGDELFFLPPVGGG